MDPTLEQLRNVSSMAEVQATFGDFLGLNAPVPAAVLRRAFADQYFRHNLILNRHRPDVLRRLFQHPGTAAFEEAEDPWPEMAASDADAAASALPSRSTAQLAAKAGRALFDWAKTGFSVLDQEAFEARFGACERCDMLVDPPGKLIYALTRAKRSDPRVCSACGCTAARKARLASEQCPLSDPSNAALSRWGEPMRGPGAG